MIHKLKIKRMYYERIFDGQKNFEIRINDRNYQAGDLIKFKPANKDEFPNLDLEELLAGVWTITYIHSGEFLDPGYVVLALGENEA